MPGKMVERRDRIDLNKKKNRKKVRIEAARVVLKDDYEGVWNVKEGVGLAISLPLFLYVFVLTSLSLPFTFRVCYFILFLLMLGKNHIQLSRFQPYLSNKLCHLFQI